MAVWQNLTSYLWGSPSQQQKSASSATGQQPLCLTITAYRKEGLSEEEYRNYLTTKHAPLVRPLMEQYGLLKYTITFNTNSTRKLMGRLFDPQFANVSDYDAIIQIVFKDVQDFVNMKADPEYKKYVIPDHEQFADTKRSKMTIGQVVPLLG